MTSPKLLFKYLKPERFDVLETLKIRFTQVSALNDPFESFPGITLREEAWYLEEFRRRFDARMDELGILGRAQRRQRWRQALKTDFPRFHACYTDVTWLLDQSEVVQHMSDAVQGCLSLSATSTNILMWSHYAHHHTGFVVGFHADHEYFGQSVSPVVYALTRPKYNPFESRHDGAIFYTKSEHWQYEQEFRKFQSLVEPIKLADGHSFAPYREPGGRRQPNEAIVLFPFPPESVARVIVGWKSSPELHSKLATALASHGLHHVPILFACPSATRYEMEIATEPLRRFKWPPD